MVDTIYITMLPGNTFNGAILSLDVLGPQEYYVVKNLIKIQISLKMPVRKIVPNPISGFAMSVKVKHVVDQRCPLP